MLLVVVYCADVAMLFALFGPHQNGNSRHVFVHILMHVLVVPQPGLPLSWTPAYFYTHPGVVVRQFEFLARDLFCILLAGYWAVV